MSSGHHRYHDVSYCLFNPLIAINKSVPSACQKTHANIIVKFIPSINISYGVDEATANFQLFSVLRKKHPDIVVGMDLCGDPTKGKFADYKEIFQQARSEGFRMALHCAEVANDDEIVDMLEFLSVGDRIGHGTFIDGESARGLM